MKKFFVMILKTLTLLFLYSSCISAGYGISSLIFRAVGTPPGIWGFLLRAFIVLALITLVLTGFRLFFQLQHPEHLKERHGYSTLLNAIDRIAKGDFGVLLEPRDAGMHHELAEAINKMAENLGTLEAMRQDFISNVSHEIQSPLTSIAGFAKLLKDENLSAEQRGHYAGIIEMESRRLSSLSDKLLKLSSLDNSNIPLIKTEFRLDKQLEQIVLSFEPQWAAKQITLEVELQKSLINADEELLSQVWVNLLHNAVKFTPGNGAIHIAMQERTVTIADTGVGIAQEDQIHIFERFYKVDKARDRSLGGNGLGLSLVKKIVELHGGKVTVSSVPGKGTTFTVTLP
jgi:signal transduction histidine kinase